MNRELIPADGSAPCSSATVELERLQRCLQAYLGSPSLVSAVTLRGIIAMCSERLTRDELAPLAERMPFSKAAALLTERSCWNKAAMTEPVFVLRANDPLAAPVVRLWASLASSTGAHNKPKTTDAWQLAMAMVDWTEENGSRRLGIEEFA